MPADKKPPSEAIAPNITVIRLLEYHGPADWVDLVLQRSAIPIQGAKQFGGRLPSGELMEGAFIRSGLVMFQEEGAADAPANAAEAIGAAAASQTVELPNESGGKTVIHLPMPPGGKTQA